jgi:pyrimidine operon attenuation protein/uracil phosphoribosyltransferase
VLVDRGGRELPIEPTYTGVTINVAPHLSIVLSRDPGGTLSLAVEPSAGVA